MHVCGGGVGGGGAGVGGGGDCFGEINRRLESLERNSLEC